MSIQNPKMDSSFTTPSNNNTQSPMKLPIPRLQPGSTGSSALAQKPQELLLTSAWPSTTTSSLSLASSLPVVPCQSLGTTPPGKPIPNKRGRKPLTTMPSTKKHIQNLTNQRAFRQRRENYIRNLETRATALEYLYQQAQEEIKNLKEQLRLLNKQLIEGDRNVRGGGLNPPESMEPQQHVNRMAGSCSGGVEGIDRQIYTGQTMIGEEIRSHQMFSMAPVPLDGSSNDIVMSDATMSPSSGSDDSSPPLQSSNGMFVSMGNPYQQQCLSPTSPTNQYVTMSATNPVAIPFASSHPSYPTDLNRNLSSTNFYDHQQDQGRNSLQHSTTPPLQRQQQQQLQSMRTQHPDPVQQSSNRRTPLAEDLLKDQLFCETKNGELCYCEPDPGSGANLELGVHAKATFQQMGGKPYIDRETGKRMWILPNEIPSNSSDPMTSSYIPNNNGSSSSSSPGPPLPSPDEPEPQWQLQQQQYYSQAPATAISPHNQSPHHQNNNHYGLKWILSEVRREEPICSGSA